MSYLFLYIICTIHYSYLCIHICTIHYSYLCIHVCIEYLCIHTRRWSEGNCEISEGNVFSSYIYKTRLRVCVCVCERERMCMFCNLVCFVIISEGNVFSSYIHKFCLCVCVCVCLCERQRLCVWFMILCVCYNF